MEKREKKVTFSQFQKLGKVLMTPVMILPIAGILVGIGSAFTTKNIVALWPVLGNTYVKLFFNLLKAMGNTINSYLPIIFAVSVAIGYAEKEKGIAALSSVIGFLAMNNVMNILLTSLGILDPAAMKTGQSMVMGIASLDTGVFGGILVGLLVAKLHNKYYNIQLPPVLGIFSGTKFVPMISLLACSALGLVMSVVWPFVQTGLGFMGEIIYDTGMAGSVIYGLAERALLPFGLHHFIYTPFFFTNLGGSMVIDGTLYEGAVNIYNAMLASPDAMFDVNITRFIMNGKVIFAMFGLPGAALAMYHCAKPERKPQVKALLIAAIIPSIFTGITEPIEYSFLFAAPLLFVVHYHFPKLDGVMNILILLPFAVPPVVSSVGLLQVYGSGPLAMVGTPWILIGCYFTVALPFMYRAITNNLQAINLRDLMDAAQLLGASTWQAAFLVVLPNLRKGLMVALLLSFSFLFGEFVFANILVGTRYETLQVYLNNMRNSSGHFNSALVISYFFFVLLFTWAATRLNKDKP
jgi:PTS system maltose and glucose-specific IIC component